MEQPSNVTRTQSHRRRPSLQLPPAASPRAIPLPSPRAIPTTSPRPIPITSPRAVPLPVPQRHGSFVGSYGSMTDFTSMSPRALRRRSMSGSFSGSTSLGNSFVLGPSVTDELDSWLDATTEDVLKEADVETPHVTGDTGLEKATELLLSSDANCLLVETGGGYGLFDYSDLNTVLLLVLISASQDVTDDVFDDRSRELVNYFKRGIRFGIGAVCDISQKNPCHSFPPHTPLRRLLPLFASGIHRVVITGETPQILTALALLAHLTRKPPPIFRMPLGEVDLPLHQLVSLPQTATVLDAMQVMSLNGLGAIGVTNGEPDREGELDSLVGVVTATDCAKAVVPSEGKQALEMGLSDMCKGVLSKYPGGDLGEERVPVHTITPATTVLHAASLILATSSVRVFMRTPPAASPPLSPVSSLERFSPPLSPTLEGAAVGLPTPPPTVLSSQYVISVLDILACLARSSPGKLSPFEPTLGSESWDMLPDSVSRRRRRASSSITGFATWRWAGDLPPF
ncbi:hypothetical protein CspHIS471_0704790 [Cutaneotrichosporon sp. HIS471]|nr:hypothetical protein CspHIS471_0704790 [Cutaneotrichosporon sp. HIS471]